MYPELRWLLPWLLLVAVALGSALHAALLRRERIPLRPLLRAYLLLLLATTAGAKLFSAWLDGGHVLCRADAGYRMPGALLGALALSPLLARLRPAELPLARWGDLLAPGAGLSLALYRVGCLVAGCCAGEVSRAPWALRFARGSEPWLAQVASGRIPSSAAETLPVLPLQIPLLALSLAAGLAALFWLPRRRGDGEALLGFLVLHETGKLALEHFRAPPEPALKLASAAVALGAAALLVGREARRRAARSARA